MTNVFDGAADDRQSNSETLPVSRFRPRYRALSDDEKKLHDAIKSKAEELEHLFDQVPKGRYASLAITALEQAIMWIIKELTANRE